MGRTKITFFEGYFADVKRLIIVVGFGQDVAVLNALVLLYLKAVIVVGNLAEVGDDAVRVELSFARSVAKVKAKNYLEPNLPCAK